MTLESSIPSTACLPREDVIAMRRQPLTRTLALLVTLATLLFASPGLRAQVSVDVHNEFANVGAIMVWLVDDDGQPLALLTLASGTLIDDKVLVTAGHFTAPVRDLGGLRHSRVRELQPDQCARSIDLDPGDRPVHLPSLCPPPDFCDPTTSDVRAAGGRHRGCWARVEHAPPGVEPAALAHSTRSAVPTRRALRRSLPATV